MISALACCASEGCQVFCAKVTSMSHTKCQSLRRRTGSLDRSPVGTEADVKSGRFLEGNGGNTNEANYLQVA